MKAVKGEEIFLSSENKIGLLEEVTRLISNTGASIRALCVFVSDGKAFFRIVTSDNPKSKQALAGLGSLETREVVIVELPDAIGTLNVLAASLKEAMVDIHYMYGTTNQPQRAAILVISTNNNDNALQALIA